MEENTAIVLGVVAAIITIVGSVTGAFRWFYRWLKKTIHHLIHLRRLRVDVPRETIRVVPQPHRTRWKDILEHDKPAMHIEGWWFVTNITEQPVQIISVHLKRPSVLGDVRLSSIKEHTTGYLEIPPRDTYAAFTIFTIQPKKRKAQQTYRVRVVFTDQYGNEFITKRVDFSYEPTKVKEDNELPVERLHTIENPIEKDVVAVLKTEVYRYGACGRRVGGLGSIHVVHEGRQWPGVGTEWRKADSPDNQSLVPSSDTSTIISDNASSLLSLYETLKDDDDKGLFVNALLTRLSATREYAPIGYFILFILFKINKLEVAMHTAKNDLRGHKLGFDEFLRLLDGLLRYEHNSFSLEDLDRIDKFLDGIDGHTFRIEERMSAIRALRLRKNIGQITGRLETV